MPTTKPNTPLLLKFSCVIFIISSLGFLWHIGQNIVSPLLLAALFAILLRPAVEFLQTKARFPNAVASLASVLLFSLFFVAIFYFVSTQVASMADDWSKIQRNLTMHYEHLQDYVSQTFSITETEQDKMVNEATGGKDGGSSKLISSTLLSFTDVLLSLIIVPVFMFLMLLYRTHFSTFFCKLFDEKHHNNLQDILATIKTAVQGYILGLFLELVIVSVLTSVGLAIIGVKYAILLGVITGLLNLIPYIGIFIAMVLTMISSLSGSSELSVVIGVVVVNIVVQLIDNNLLVPWIVSSKVEINALATISGIIVAGSVAGISGMFLAIPLLAVAKCVFDRIDGLEAWGYLLGDDLPKSFSWKKMRKLKT